MIRRGPGGSFPAGTELIEGDLERPDSVKAALDQATQVFCGVGGPRGTPNLVEVECRLIDLAAAAHVKQYVKVSGIDARPDSHCKIQRIHGEIEAHLRRSGLGHTVLRPSFFLQNLLSMSAAIRQGALPLPTGSARCGLIDAGDVAEVGAVVLSDDKHLGQVYTLTGPASNAGVAARTPQVCPHSCEPPEHWMPTSSASAVCTPMSTCTNVTSRG